MVDSLDQRVAARLDRLKERNLVRVELSVAEQFRGGENPMKWRT